MSVKWRQVQKWDDENLRGPLLRPVWFLLRAFSSITLAVILLVLVVLYGISASVPVGLIALAPTFAFYAMTLILAVAAAAMLVWWSISRIVRGGGAVALSLRLICGGAAAAAGAYAWWYWIWPLLKFSPERGTGVRFFHKFVERNYSVTLRRLPGIEMSELEYYSWWPLRWILLLFVLNMVVSTVRRIEFSFKNIGVLTVHTGIVVIALGSIYYSGLKREGDTILFAGRVNERTGLPGVGPPQDRFFDNTRVAVYVSTGDGQWDACPLRGVPRYNDYNLAAGMGESAWETAGRKAPWRVSDQGVLDIPCVPLMGRFVDPGLTLRVIGYCHFAESVNDWVRLPETSVGGDRTPLRIVYMHSAIPDKDGVVDAEKPVFSFTLAPSVPKDRIADVPGTFAIEYTMGARAGMPEERWKSLSEPLPPGTMHALVVEVPGANYRGVFPVMMGTLIEAGATGYKILVKELRPQPPFPIITPGYKDADSSIAVVTITPPALSGVGAAPYDRWVYHRFPGIDQDLLSELNPTGMPKRRDADGAIRVTLVESDQLQVYLDEPEAGRSRAIVRSQGGAVKVHDPLPADGWVDLGLEKVRLRIGERWENSRQVERPVPASAEAIRADREAVGTHDKAMLAVEARNASGAAVVWLPFAKYFGMGPSTERTVTLPDGSVVELAFGRLQHPLPGFVIQLADFQMIAYDHRGAPRDYQSILKVTPTSLSFEPFEHVTKLNAPLTAPFWWDERRTWLANAVGRLRSGLSPHQFKFSQAGWDAQGWNRTQRLADEGQIPKPFASFTILGVGNNAGIHIIALGSVLMGLGIPWAFYVKPWLVRREKRRVQEQVKSGTYVKPARIVVQREPAEVSV